MDHPLMCVFPSRRGPICWGRRHHFPFQLYPSRPFVFSAAVTWWIASSWRCTCSPPCCPREALLYAPLALRLRPYVTPRRHRVIAYAMKPGSHAAISISLALGIRPILGPNDDREGPGIHDRVTQEAAWKRFPRFGRTFDLAFDAMGRIISWGRFRSSPLSS